MRLIVSAVALMLAGEAMAQTTMRARMTGSRGNGGKCTIEVEVDGIAEVEVRGDTGRIHTIAGQPSTWRRMECSDALPSNPVDFRFKGIDGRGKVNLVRDPTQTRGMAVVRIEDPKGGREGYTFDLEWSGTGADYGRGGNGSGRFDENRRGRRNREGYTITCESTRNRRQYCTADTTGGVTLQRDLSNGACREGSSWGFDNRGVWVDRGCAAEFRVGGNR